MLFIGEHAYSFVQSSCFVSVIRVREFRARVSEPVICDLDFPFCHLSFDILTFPLLSRISPLGLEKTRSSLLKNLFSTIPMSASLQ